MQQACQVHWTCKEALRHPADITTRNEGTKEGSKDHKLRYARACWGAGLLFNPDSRGDAERIWKATGRLLGSSTADLDGLARPNLEAPDAKISKG